MGRNFVQSRGFLNIFSFSEMPPKLKSSTNVFLIGQPSSVLDEEFLKALQSEDAKNLLSNPSLLPFIGLPVLPTRMQVLKLYFGIRQTPAFSLAPQQIVATMVVEQVTKYWRMAPLETQCHKWLVNKVILLVKEHEIRRKSSGRKSDGEIKKRKEFMDSLKLLFDIAASDAEDFIKKNRLLKKNKDDHRIEEDLTFLQDQRGPRKMSMLDGDFEYTKSVTDKAKKKEKEKADEIQRQKDLLESKKRPQMTSDDIGEDLDDDENYIGPQPAKKKKSDTIVIELPRNPWKNADTTAMMDRLKLTPSQSVGFFSSIVNTGTVNGETLDLNEFVCSVSTVARHRNKNRGVLFELSQDEFRENMPKHVNIHADGKQLANWFGEKEECEAILASGPPHYKEGKLLNVSKIPSSSGENQFGAIKEEVILWDLKARTRAFTADTTGSCMGCHLGWCKRMEEWMERPCFWFGCRHHISELLAKAAWYAIFEEDLQPNNQFFEAVKSCWDDLNTSSDAEVQILPENMFKREEAITFLKEVLSKRNQRNELLIRDDYKELVETALVLLGAKPDNFTWKKCGATHKARFCAFGIYINKSFAFAMQLDVDAETVEGLKRLATFFCTIYIPYFIASSRGSDAAVNDLQLIRDLHRFSDIDSELAEVTLAVINRHTWYLQEETVPFALFSSKLDVDQKSGLAAKILTFEKEKPRHWNEEDSLGETYQLGKPVMELQLTPDTTLTDLVGTLSFLPWDILGLDWEWLRQSPDKWNQFDSFLEMQEFVTNVKVTNDIAERGVKLIIDYAHILTSSEEMRAWLLLGVERNRRMFPNMAKSTLNLSK